MFKGNEKKFIDPPLRIFDFFNTRKRTWLLPILYLIYKLILKGILILGSPKSSRCQTTLQNSQIPLVGLGGTFACYHALTRAFEQLSRAARRGSPFRTTSFISGPFVWHLFVQLISNLLPTERYCVFYENCVSLYLSHLFISSEARKSAPKKLAIGPRPWTEVGGNFIYGSLWIAG